MIQIRNMVIAGLILVVILGGGYLIYKKNKDRRDFERTLDRAVWREKYIEKPDRKWKFDSSLRAHESKMWSLLKQLGYSDQRAEDTIRAQSDKRYFDTISRYVDKEWVEFYRDYRKKHKK